MEIHRQPRESKRKRFKPWENLRRMFQRKNSTASDHQPVSKGQSSSTSRLSGVFGLAGSSRSRSTSELLTTEPQPIPASGHNCTATKNRTASVAGSLGAGLSVSHDSVFGLDISPESDAYFTQHRNQAAAESLPSSASLQYMSELRAAIGGRHRSAEDDEGLPRSPVNATPTTARVLVDYSIHNNTAHSGGGSDPSLLSINSCELDETPFVSIRNQQQQQAQPQQQSGKVFQRAGSNNTTENITEGRADGGDDGLLGMATALNHSAARHKISIRPKRNHAPARPRQLPQLAEGPIEDDLAWTSHPSGDAVQPHPSVPERKSRIGRLLRSEPVSGSSYKQRSISLSRTEDSAIREAPVLPASAVSGGGGHVDPNSSSSSPKPSAGSSSVKLARSKSSVEKKIQHEVAVFWRRTKEGKLFHKRDNSEKEAPANADQVESKGLQQQAEPAEVKRKDLRKIKRDKEEKRKRSDVSANKEDSSPPFLSRIFGSRRSSRRLRKKNPPSPVPSHIPESRTPSPAAVPSEALPVPKPRTVFRNHDDEEEMEIDWTVPNQPYSYAPPSSRSVPATQSNRLLEKWADADFHVRAPVASPKASRTEDGLKMSPTPARHHRIHIAGLSPYQRRVARIGNGLEISDDEWDKQEPTISPTRSYHFRADEKDSERKSGLSLNLENSMKSLPVNINQEFTLKKASPVLKPPSDTVAGENLRRSFEILKFSNEGLKKTIHSFNPKRISQSSDQLHLSDGSGQRESSGSLSNSTSSLNISDGDDAADTNGSMNSVSVQSTEEKDVRDDVLIVDDHKETIQHHPDWADYKADAEEQQNALSADCVPINNTTTADSPSSHPGNVLESVRNEEPIPTSPVIHPCGSNALQEAEIRVKAPSPDESAKPPKHKSWENRQLAAAADTPAMFSMSVRVQNPPDAKYKRSMSTPNSEASLSANQSFAPEMPAVRKLSETFQAPRPFIMSVRMGGVDGEGIPASLPPQQLMAKLSARPWQTKEEKDRQNKVALVRSQHVEPEPPPDAVKPEETESAAPVEPVKLRPKTPAKEETSELLKVFARRSVKVRDSKDLTDAVEGGSAEARNEVLSGSIPPCRPALMECVTKEDMTVSPADVIGQSVEKVDLSKEKMPLKKIAKPPVAIRTMIGEKPALIEPPTDRFLKSSGRVQPFFRSTIQESAPTTDHSSIRPFVPLLIRLPTEDKNSSDPAEQSSKDSSPISPSQTDPIFEECASDTNRIIESSTMSQDETVWKKHQPKSRPSDRFLSSNRFVAKSIDEEVKAATAAPPIRQSKVLDMVNNFQRLQVT
ncbi:uncharacterized protein LOC130696026 [Daphnia carinata]|uniref:uncharacterized protein LOC130696026 n=1 Tax=Daphnia carinata TaxID=120202 RepID=UPI00257A2391|nr:uncharacterized protein LOC130696026 [Daphnia carinata]